MIHILRTPATASQISDMLDTLGTYIKLAVDVKEEILAGGGEMHADCEAALLEVGCHQSNRWGADWNPGIHSVEFHSLINIRPGTNDAMAILDEDLRGKVRQITEELLGKP